nr:unnamed protein product [Spirometra erinaceieuropaei]
MAEQAERAFQKQAVLGKKGTRYYKSIGLGYKTPKEAIFGTYIDKKCPFTSDVTIRGRILTGIVRKMKMNRTIVIRRDYLKYVKKYKRFERRHKNMSVHLSPCFRSSMQVSGVSEPQRQHLSPLPIYLCCRRAFCVWTALVGNLKTQCHNNTSAKAAASSTATGSTPATSTTTTILTTGDHNSGVSAQSATALQLFKKRLDDNLCPLFSLDSLNMN